MSGRPAPSALLELASDRNPDRYPFQQDVANTTLLDASDLASRATIPACVCTHQEKEEYDHPNRSKYGYLFIRSPSITD